MVEDVVGYEVEDGLKLKMVEMIRVRVLDRVRVKTELGLRLSQG